MLVTANASRYTQWTSSDGRYVVNDALYITALAAPLAQDLNVTVRVNASIVSLTAKDFMAIAIQSTAADN